MKNGIETGGLEKEVVPVQDSAIKNSGMDGVERIDGMENRVQACGMENGVGAADGGPVWSTVEPCSSDGSGGNCWLDSISTPSSSDGEDPVPATLDQLLKKK